MNKVTEIYNKQKLAHPFAVVLIAVGDFYETYGSDAEILTNVCGITLTKRSNGDLLGGFPKHSLNTYLKMFEKQGFKVVVCDLDHVEVYNYNKSTIIETTQCGTNDRICIVKSKVTAWYEESGFRGTRVDTDLRTITINMSYDMFTKFMLM